MKLINFIDFLEKDLPYDEPIAISLKSCVPVFVVYPEFMPEGYSIENVNKLCDHSIDYHDKGLYIDQFTNDEIKELLTLFSSVLSNLVTAPPSNIETEEYPFPKLSLSIDIGKDNKEAGIITPTAEQVKRFGTSQTFTFRARIANEEVELSDNKKHNILLVDMLKRMANDTGLGGL